MERKMKVFNMIYPIYDGLSADLLFFIAIDTLFLAVEKNLSASRIALLGVVPSLICIMMKPLIDKIIEKVGNANSSKIGTLMLLVSSILITFGNSFIVIAIGQLVYDMAFVFKVVESIILKNNLAYQNKSDLFVKMRGRAKTIYAVITFFIALIIGQLFNIDPYLPMYCCIGFCILTLLLSFAIIEVTPEAVKQEKEEIRHSSSENTRSVRKIVALAILSNTLFLGLVILGQQYGKLFIQYQLIDYKYALELVATYIGYMVAVSRATRVVLNIFLNKLYLKIGEKLVIVLNIMLMTTFGFIIIGAVIPATTVVKIVLMALGFSLIIPLMDPFNVYMEDLLLRNSEKSEQSNEQPKIFVSMELTRKLGKIVLNAIISVVLIKYSLLLIILLFFMLALVELGINFIILTRQKSVS